MKTQISAKIVADSLGPAGTRLTTMILTFPRFILAEGKTHRILSGMIQETSVGINDDAMFSKNSASSRAIPFNKMIESVQNDPFVPVAWQKEHKGMQGTDYLNEVGSDVAKMEWIVARDSAIQAAKILTKESGVTKQLANRLLEPFMWHTVLVSFTESQNFFNLRCPEYVFETDSLKRTFKSRKDALRESFEANDDVENGGSDLDWLKINKGQAEIHMMLLAEKMYDAMMESTPCLLDPDEWHIPFLDKMCAGLTLQESIKVATAMCARVSYTTVGDEKEFTLEQQIALHDRILSSGHASPTEHIARVMTDYEYRSNHIVEDGRMIQGVSRNFRGFMQYRQIIGL